MKFSVAIAISAGIHILLGAGLWLYVESAPTPDVTVSLDLSGVELSFAEREDDAATVLPQMPIPELPVPEIGKILEIEPEIEGLSELPPIPGAVDIPRPEEKPEVKTPDIPKPAKNPESEKGVVPESEPQSSSRALPPTPAVAPRQAKIDAPPRPRRTIKPDYPKGSRQRGEQGDVMLEMEVNSNGTVENARILTSSGFAELDDAALRAVRAASFVPAESGGRAVVSAARIKLTFRLR